MRALIEYNKLAIYGHLQYRIFCKKLEEYPLQIQERIITILKIDDQTYRQNYISESEHGFTNCLARIDFIIRNK